MTTTSNTRAGERCPTCQRKPSERIGDVEAVCGDCNGPRPSEPCDDPVHGMADAAPALYEALREVVRDGEHDKACRSTKSFEPNEGQSMEECDCFIGRARAALSIATEGK